MSLDKGVDILDFLVLMTKWKKFLLILLACSLVASYVAIYFFVDEQFDSTSVLIPLDDENEGGLTGVMKGLKGLPMGLSAGSLKADIGKYNTIIYSRTTLEDIIARFGLVRVYRLDSLSPDHLEKAVKRLGKEITTEETGESALTIVVRSNNAQRAADINNYLITLLNRRAIDLKVNKSRESRMFLEKRVEEIREDLRKSEDSLKAYQEASKMFEVESQLKEILTAYSDLESKLISRQVERGILEKIYDKGSPQVINMDIEISEYQKKLSQLRNEGQPGSILLSVNGLPSTTEEYVRRFRNVKIGNALLEFIIPLYEQSKIDEKRDYPVLQVIDYAIPPVKRSYPQRTFLAALITIAILVTAVLIILIRENIITTTNPRVRFILGELSMRSKKE